MSTGLLFSTHSVLLTFIVQFVVVFVCNEAQCATNKNGLSKCFHLIMIWYIHLRLFSQTVLFKSLNQSFIIFRGHLRFQSAFLWWYDEA